MQMPLKGDGQTQLDWFTSAHGEWSPSPLGTAAICDHDGKSDLLIEAPPAAASGVEPEHAVGVQKDDDAFHGRCSKSNHDVARETAFHASSFSDDCHATIKLRTFANWQEYSIGSFMMRYSRPLPTNPHASYGIECSPGKK